MIAKPTTHQGDLANLPTALSRLTKQERLVVWNWELRKTKGGKEKWTKPPRQARDPRALAKSNDPKTWAPYRCALDAVQARKAEGIGYMLLGSDLGAVDLDHVRDPATGTVLRWAQQLVEEANGAYCETTVSGSGLRILGRATGPEIQRKFTFDRKTGAGIELYRNTARYITLSGLQVGKCAELPPLDDFLDELLTRYDGAAFDFNDAGPQASQIDYDAVIKNGAPAGSNRSNLFHSAVGHLYSQGLTLDQIVDELGRHPNGIGAKYAGRLYDEVKRSYDKWHARKRTAATGRPAASAAPWPTVIVKPGELPRVLDEAEAALLASKREFFQRGGLVVRPVLSPFKAADNRDAVGWQLIPVTQPHLVDVFTGVARFVRFDRRAKAMAPIDAPAKVCDSYLARQGRWKLPVLIGIANAPFLRSDGSICQQPGYDSASGVLLKPDGQGFPPVPERPSEDDALDALNEINRLIGTFPFVSAADWSVAISAILTALDRRSMPTAPLHAFTAPSAGTGKSMLVDIAAMLATGRLMPVIAQGRNEEELEKRLGAELLAGNLAVSIDNIEYPLQSSFLCQALTQRQLNIRVLGLSKVVETPTNASLYATGNNLVISGDLVRRTLMCSLDAGCERPELRRFDTDPIEVIRAERGKLVVAALTVLRAWHVSGERMEIMPFGGFEAWSRRIREPLIWLGASDPCETATKVRTNDPKRAALEAVVLQWKEHLGTRTGFTVQQVIDHASKDVDFHAALRNVAAGDDIGVSNARLGRWLASVEGKIVERHTLKREGNVHGYPLWRLFKIAGTTTT
jgi:hypothetical protein